MMFIGKFIFLVSTFVKPTITKVSYDQISIGVMNRYGSKKLNKYRM